MTDYEQSGQPGYEIMHDPELMTMLVRLPGDFADRQVVAQLDQHGFTPKPELHLTLIGKAYGRDLLQAMSAMTPAERMVTDISLNRLVAMHDWTVTPQPVFYRLEKQYSDEAVPRQSVIQLVDCLELESFYNQLRPLFPGLPLATPLAHVTLATRHNPRGIGIVSHDELTRYGQAIAL